MQVFRDLQSLLRSVMARHALSPRLPRYGKDCVTSSRDSWVIIRVEPGRVAGTAEERLAENNTLGYFAESAMPWNLFCEYDFYVFFKEQGF